MSLQDRRKGESGPRPREGSPVNEAAAAALRERFDAVRRQYPPEMKSSLVLPLLHCAQQATGYLTEGDATMIAEYIGVPAIQVVEALHWYSMFERAPQGRHVLKVCRSISCALRGAEDLIAQLQSKLGIEVGETTPDGRCTLRTVECLASCATAPVMQVNDTHHECLDEARLDEILKGLP